MGMSEGIICDIPILPLLNIEAALIRLHSPSYISHPIIPLQCLNIVHSKKIICVDMKKSVQQINKIITQSHTTTSKILLKSTTP